MAEYHTGLYEAPADYLQNLIAMNGESENGEERRLSKSTVHSTYFALGKLLVKPIPESLVNMSSFKFARSLPSRC